MKTVSRHKSTASRAPRQFTGFKQFFIPKVDINEKEDQSARAVQTLIREMIELELYSQRISDKILSKKLPDKGISKTQRTVPKYREQMNFPWVTQRKSAL